MNFGINALDYSKNRISEAEKDLAALDIKDADIKPKASENIDNIINFISKLIEKGYAYKSDKGDVYYSVSKFSGYGKLSNRNLEDAINGVRKDVEEGKIDPLDFALWKSAKPNEISWESPWREGQTWLAYRMFYNDFGKFRANYRHTWRRKRLSISSP